MISQELEVALHRAFVNAREQRHEFIGTEHLLSSLLDTPSATRVLEGCGADVGGLRKTIAEYIARETRVVFEGEVDTQPTLGFQRVIQRALLKTQSSGRKEVTGADVLLALFVEKDSHAVRFLAAQGIGRLEVANFISAGTTTPEDQLPKERKREPEREAVAPEHAESDVQVVLYSDDFTPMEFVVDVLQDFFALSREEAAEAMLEIHRKGAAVCGLYSSEAGEEIVRQVLGRAAEHGYPLRCAAVIPKS